MMFWIERLSSNVGEKLTSTLKFDDNQKQIISYGAFAFFQTLWCIILVILVSLCFGVLREALIISITGSVLRKYSGGAHASSPNHCAVIGVITSVGFGLIINRTFTNINITYLLLFILFSFIYSYFQIVILAPVDSKAKPIKNPDKRLKLKRKSIFLLSILAVLIVILLFIYLKLKKHKFVSIIGCICIAIIWQSFTLTKCGHAVIRGMDFLLNKIFIRIGGKRI